MDGILETDENTAHLEEKILMLKSYFYHNGLLFCNSNGDLPDIGSIGGDWDSIVALIEQGEVFYSKLYKNRVTYLSRELYYQIKPYRQRVDNLSDKSKEVIEFLEANDSASTKTIKYILGIPSKEFTICINELCKELLVTAVKRDRTINVNWSSFKWGTFQQWERLKPLPKVGHDAERLNILLSTVLTENQIRSLLR